MLNGGYLEMKGTMFKFVKLKKQKSQMMLVLSQICVSASTLESDQ